MRINYNYGEPPHSCPQCDDVITLANEMADDEEKESRYRTADDIIRLTEKTREANSTLRDWAYSLIETIKEHESTIKEMELQIDKLEDQISSKY
jgi:septin family protein